MYRSLVIAIFVTFGCSVPSGTFTASGDGGGGGGLAFVLSSEQVTVDEGGSAMFTVALSERPVGVEIVTVASVNSSIATVAPTSLGFDGDNWSLPKVVTVSALE